ncbi:MAG: hypothetical protein ACTS4U_01040 [Candidatus Hodgkinia cicadicola]
MPLEWDIAKHENAPSLISTNFNLSAVLRSAVPRSLPAETTNSAVFSRKQLLFPPRNGVSTALQPPKTTKPTTLQTEFMFCNFPNKPTKANYVNTSNQF